MALVDRKRLAEIEGALKEHGSHSIRPNNVRDLCETIRSAWKERDEEIARVTMLRAELGDIYRMAQDGQHIDNDPLAWLELIEQRADEASGKVTP